MYKAGDKVIKNPTNWEPNEFDGWGRGVGVGEVVEVIDDGDGPFLDVRWPNGKCWEKLNQVMSVSNLIDDYQIETDPETKKEMGRSIIQYLNTKRYWKADDYHLKGLVGYFADIGDDNHKILRDAIKDFNMALIMDAEYNWSKLFIGHCYQDLGEYNNALEFYNKVDLDWLGNIQPWRKGKLLEQIGYCHWKLAKKQLADSYFLYAYVIYAELDQDDLPNFNEMMECLPEDHELYLRYNRLLDD